MDRSTLVWTSLTAAVIALFVVWSIDRAGGGASLPAGSWVDGVPWAPSCRDRRIADHVASIWHTHPNYAGRVDVRLVALHDPRQVGSQVHEHEGEQGSTRWCAARGDFGEHGTATVVWALFASDTVLGVAYGIHTCFGPFEPDPARCGAELWPFEVRVAAGLDPEPHDGP